jgi:BASS family bile acid:Na+ symporter
LEPFDAAFRALPAAPVTVVAATTLLIIMFHMGLGAIPGQWRWVWRHRALMAKALLSVLVLLPLLALAVSIPLELPWQEEIGIILMAIAPGAPLALRRSLRAGGHAAFAPVLQIALALAAVVSMPVWLWFLNFWYHGHASVSPWDVARQVFAAQILPLAAGMLAQRLLPKAAVDWLRIWLQKLGILMLAAFLLLAMLDVWRDVIGATRGLVFAIVVITALALAMGHALGRPRATVRTVVAIATAARNPGLALLVGILNGASSRTMDTILAYVVFSALTVTVYTFSRRTTTRARAIPA